MKFKSEIAPKGIEWHSSDFVMSEKYCTVLTVISYPREVRNPLKMLNL